MMNIDLLQNAIRNIKTEIEQAISTSAYGGKEFSDGRSAKEALIRSQNLILKIHEVVKISLAEEISKYRSDFSIFPPIGSRSPEKKIYGFLKGKKQDVVCLFDDSPDEETTIFEGPLEGTHDPHGKAKSEKAIVIGVRSQFSSIGKNFDTLMERSFAETLNLRLRLPNLIMGDVYLIPVVEYNDNLMTVNTVAWKQDSNFVGKYINTFLAISNRSVSSTDQEIYKYDRVALILVDFRPNTPKIFLSTNELKDAGFLPPQFTKEYELISPINFAHDICERYKMRHPYFG